jgi:acyl carrier protein
VKEKIMDIIATVLDTPADALSEQLTYRQLDTWDSLAHMNLILSLEQAFNIEFTPLEVTEMISIELVLDTVLSKMQQAVK